VIKKALNQLGTEKVRLLKRHLEENKKTLATIQQDSSEKSVGEFGLGQLAK